MQKQEALSNMTNTIQLNYFARLSTKWFLMCGVWWVFFYEKYMVYISFEWLHFYIIYFNQTVCNWLCPLSPFSKIPDQTYITWKKKNIRMTLLWNKLVKPSLKYISSIENEFSPSNLIWFHLIYWMYYFTVNTHSSDVINFKLCKQKNIWVKRVINSVCLSYSTALEYYEWVSLRSCLLAHLLQCKCN